MARSPEICVLLAPERAASRSGEGALALKLAGSVMFVALAVGIFYLGAQPVAVGMFPSPYDKIAHFLVYFLTTAAAGLAGLHTSRVRLLLLGIALGAADELHQLYLPGRSAGWDDFMVDVLAVSLAAWVVPFAMKLPGHASPAHPSC